MTTVRVHRHAAEGEPPLQFEAQSIGAWLLQHYGDAPAHGVFVFAGEPSKETDVTGDVPALLRNDAPLYVVLETPGEPISLTAILTSIAVSTAISFVANLLFGKDPKPLDNRSQESPNNALSARDNRLRILQRVEDIFGTVRAIPSLIMQTYTKYIAHRQVEYGLLCIGRGYYEVDDVREGDTLLADVTGSSAAVYAPFTSPNSGSPQLLIGDPIIDPILSVTRSIGVESVVLKAANQLSFNGAAMLYKIRQASATATDDVPPSDDDIIFQPEPSRRPNFAAIAAPGQLLTFQWESTTITRTIGFVGDGYVILTNGPDASAFGLVQVVSGVVDIDTGVTDWTDWTTLSETDRTEVWTNVVARGGMFKDDGSKSGTSVTYEVQIEQLDEDLAPTGVVETVTGSVEGSTSIERAETLERVTAWTGPARVRARRVTPFDYNFSGFVQDEITWTDLYAVAPVTKPDFGNKTIIHTVSRATQAAAGLRQRQLNCLASRLLPTFNGSTFSGALNSTGALASGTLNPTSRIVDILAAVTVDPKIGARAIDDIDLAQIWSVQQALDAWHPEVGQFNYTFDSDELSYEETINAIANAAFCAAYRQNGQIRLALDRPQAASVALFTHRNKKPRTESVTRSFASDADYDGVELVYVDPESEAQETIRLPLDGSFTKLKRVEVTGIRSYEQAWLRANREYQRLRYQRLVIETECTADARALLPNSRVDVVDNTRFKSFDGEVIAQNGLELTLSREVEFLPATAHSIVLMKRDGTPQSIAVTPGTAANRVLLAAPPAEALVTTPTPEDGIRTIFSFAADSARGAQAWLVQEIAPTDAGYMRVRAVNYAPEYYAADTLAIPARAGVIN